MIEIARGRRLDRSCCLWYIPVDDLIITIKPIEIWVTTIVVPPCSLIVHSTVEATVLVIVSVTSGELHAIQVVMSSHPVTCCPYPQVLVPSNSESVSPHENNHNRQTWNSQSHPDCMMHSLVLPVTDVKQLI